MRFIPALNKSPDEMLRLISSQELDATGRFEVVHYLGFGEMVRDEARIALCTTPGDAEMIPLAEFLEIVAHAKPRLLVCEFLLPRSGTQPDPLLPSAFKQALTGRLNAVVTTRFPMHPSQVDAFDGGLYQGIADGLTIEAAVQRARGVVYRNAPLNSATAFGAYTLITGPASGMTMLAGRSGSGPQQPPPSVSASPTPSDPPKYTFKRTGAGA